jgi:ribonuclease HI
LHPNPSQYDNGENFEASDRLNYFCTNNQAKYEASLFGLEILTSIKVRHVKSFDDSLLVVQQVSGEWQCLERSLNTYLDKCLDVIKLNFDEFCIHHIPRHENRWANDLAQEASSYNVQDKNFHVETKLVLGGEEILLYTKPNGLTTTHTGQTATRCDQTARTQGGQRLFRIGTKTGWRGLEETDC